MRMAPVLLILVFLSVTQGASALSVQIIPQDITFSFERLEEIRKGFSLVLETTDPSWMLLAALEESLPSGTIVLHTPQSKNPIPLSGKPQPVLFGKAAFPEGVKVDFALSFTPPWTLEAGVYTSRLVLYYQREGAPPLPIPQGISLSLEIPKTFEVDIAQGGGTLHVEVSGPPGRYFGEPLTLTVRANATPWALLCTTSGFSRPDGGHIPPSRVLVSVRGKWYSLEHPVTLVTGRGGEEVTLSRLVIAMDTVASDPPGEYTGEVAFFCAFATKGGVP